MGGHPDPRSAGVRRAGLPPLHHEPREERAGAGGGPGGLAAGRPRGGLTTPAAWRVSPRRSFGSAAVCSGQMNNTCFIFLIRRDHVLELTAHLAAGILALVLLTGASSAGSRAAAQPAATTTAVAGR